MGSILLLHGAIGAKDQLQETAGLLSAHHDVYCMNFSGHGGEPFSDTDFSIERFAKEVLDCMSLNKIDSANIFGYSMGGYVGLYLARHYPEKIKSVATLGTKFDWDPTIAEKEIQLLNAEKIEAKLPTFAAILKKRHEPNDWKTVLQRTADMLVAMGKHNPLTKEDHSLVQQPILLILGDRDKMVSLEETLGVYSRLPNAQLSILPATPHPIEMVKTERLVFEIISFLA